MVVDVTAVPPVVKGDWIESLLDTRPRIAKVVDCYLGTDGEWVVDIAFFSAEGVRIGRESKPLGGPRNYEPAVPYRDNWRRVERPRFPLRLVWRDDAERYSTGLKGFGDRTTAVVTAERKSKVVTKTVKAPNAGNFDPELEVRARRLAIEQLRDLMKTIASEEIAERIAKLEKEADAIAAEHGIIG